MSKGVKRSVYFTENNVRLCNDIAESSGISFSDAVNKAVRKSAMFQQVKLNISEGACLCLKEGRYDLINRVVLENGVTVLLMKEEAYRQQGGSDGEFKSAKDDLLAYLDGDKAS